MFWIKLVIPKYHTSCHCELTVKGNIFTFIKVLTLFCEVLMSVLMVIFSKKYLSKYPCIIWWIMVCIMNELWKIQIIPS